MKYILLLSITAMLLSGCGSNQTKETVDFSKRDENGARFYQQREVYVFAEQLRSFCGDDALRFFDDLDSLSHREPSAQALLDLVSKYKSKLASASPVFQRPSFSPVYGPDTLYAIEEQAKRCKEDFSTYLKAFPLSFNEANSGSESVRAFLNTKSILFASTYALEYETYFYKPDALSFMMNNYVYLMYQYYDLLRDGYEVLLSHDETKVLPYVSTLQKRIEAIKQSVSDLNADFYVLRGLYFTAEQHGKVDKKTLDEKGLEQLQAHFVRSEQAGLAQLNKEYDAFKASGKHLDNLAVFLSSLDLEVTLRDRQTRSKRIQYQKQLLWVLRKAQTSASPAIQTSTSS